MESLTSNLSIQISDRFFVKNPDSSEIGQRIIEWSIILIEEIGFEAFTFKKLAIQIGTTEATIYRYFESKHRLLLYLTCWYWSWMEYRLLFAITNVESAEERLNRSIGLLTEVIEEDSNFSYVNEVKLNNIVIAEASKSYLNKDVDKENKEGAYLNYKKLVQRISEIILEINPNYKYPHMLVSTVIEGAHLQRYFAEHLPGLTDTNSKEDSVAKFFKQMVFKSIE
ncbi:MAG: helix-turn-helix transcriptional regulator [Cyclobacteriaceae bacterium]|nr:helix-turn-helix transcriptional regulator [Cyclobacteriaceae bacterium]